jgi:hypothetical protein
MRRHGLARRRNEHPYEGILREIGGGFFGQPAAPQGGRDVAGVPDEQPVQIPTHRNLPRRGCGAMPLVHAIVAGDSGRGRKAQKRTEMNILTDTN